MFISIILPNFNHAIFLEERIESILNQTYQNFELIILDDCSSDQSKEIIEKYRYNPKVSEIIINRVNSGSLFLQWKKGVELAKGDWIWIAESDDVSSVNFLEKLVVKISRNTSLAYCKSKIIDEQGIAFSDTTTWLEDLSSDRWNHDFVNNGIEEFFNYHAYKNVVSNTSSALFRKSFMDDIKYYPSKYKTCGDWLFFAQISMLGEVIYVAEPLNYWRQHKATTRNSFSLQYDSDKLRENTSIIRVFESIAQEKNRKLDYSKYKWLVDWWMSKFLYENIFKKSFVNPSFPYPLKWSFYIRLIFRTFVEVSKSVKSKLYKVK